MVKRITWALPPQPGASAPLEHHEILEALVVGGGRPLTEGEPTPLPDTGRARKKHPSALVQPRPMGGLQVRAHRLLVDKLELVTDDATLLAGHAPFGTWGGRGYRRTRRTNLLYMAHSPVARNFPAGLIDVHLRNDEGRAASQQALAALQHVIAATGGPRAWRVSRIDIAVDYALWQWDLLVIDGRRAPTLYPDDVRARCEELAVECPEREWSPQEAREYRRIMRDDHEQRRHRAQTIYFGRKEDHTLRVYWRGHEGDAVTRIEREVRAPEQFHMGRQMTLPDLPQLADPFGGVIVRPVWGVHDLAVARRLRTVQLFGVASASEASWCACPDAVSYVEQPSAAWRRLGADALYDLLRAVKVVASPPAGELFVGRGARKPAPIAARGGGRTRRKAAPG